MPVQVRISKRIGQSYKDFWADRHPCSTRAKTLNGSRTERSRVSTRLLPNRSQLGKAFRPTGAPSPATRSHMNLQVWLGEGHMHVASGPPMSVPGVDRPLATVDGAVVAGAAARTESHGYHCRSDILYTSTARLRHVAVRLRAEDRPRRAGVATPAG
jgi:hypothetical protein